MLARGIKTKRCIKGDTENKDYMYLCLKYVM
jgi:hypothetical protein